MASTNAAAFSLGLERFASHVEDRRRQITKAVTLEALRRLVLSTRVDTGRARGNYQIQEGSPPTGHIERFDHTGSQGTLDVISLEGRKIFALSGDSVVWIHNGVPYIGILEDRDKMLVGTVTSLETWLRSMPPNFWESF